MLWGTALGGGCSVLVIAYATILRLARGPNAFVYYGLTFETLSVAYIVGGIGGGLILGLARPLTRWRSGGIVTSILVATFVYGAAAVAMHGWITRWNIEDWAGVLVLGLGTGTIGGNRFWEEFVYPKLPPPLPSSDVSPPRRPFGLWRP